MVELMDNQKIMFVGLILVIAIGIFYFSSNSIIKQNVTKSDYKNEILLLQKGSTFGKSSMDYSYNYTESVDDYTTTYMLTKSGNSSIANIINPLSTKTIYYLDNDTIMCLNYSSNSCSSFNGTTDTAMARYLESIKSLFLKDSQIDKNEQDLDFLIANKYLTINSQMTPKIINGHNCQEIIYTIDYSNMTVSDAARFGITANSPKVFGWKMCIDNSSGFVYSKYFNYSTGNVVHEYKYTLNGYSKSTSTIQLPNFDLGDNVGIEIRDQMDQQSQLIDCYWSKRGDERDICIASRAQNIKNLNLCRLAGSRADRCLVSLVPVLKNETICQMIQENSYKDDCQIELAGAYKNNSYCSALLNQSKNVFCQEVSLPVQRNSTIQNTSTTNVTAQQNSTRRNVTAADIEAENILIRSEVPDSNSTASNNATNSSAR